MVLFKDVGYNFGLGAQSQAIGSYNKQSAMRWSCCSARVLSKMEDSHRVAEENSYFRFRLSIARSDARAEACMIGEFELRAREEARIIDASTI